MSVEIVFVNELCDRHEILNKNGNKKLRPITRTQFANSIRTFESAVCIVIEITLNEDNRCTLVA